MAQYRKAFRPRVPMAGKNCLQVTIPQQYVERMMRQLGCSSVRELADRFDLAAYFDDSDVLTYIFEPAAAAKAGEAEEEDIHADQGDNRAQA